MHFIYDVVIHVLFYICRGEIDKEPPFQRNKIGAKQIDHTHFYGRIILLVKDDETNEEVYKFDFKENDPQTIYYKIKEKEFKDDDEFRKNKVKGTECVCMLMQQIDSNKITNEQCVNHKVKLNNI